jgi:hypothetical protein
LAGHWQVNAQAAGVYSALRAFKAGLTRPLNSQQPPQRSVVGVMTGVAEVPQKLWSALADVFM